nr:MAG TPA: hypothetical protein [Caudoviricetes sp.]
MTRGLFHFHKPQNTTTPQKKPPANHHGQQRGIILKTNNIEE